ncbi:MAG: hypothetical protein COT00_01585, partial [Candidatus Omnitrophica bacterium CG07_land_8_20_14_0_80_50_8]
KADVVYDQNSRLRLAMSALTARKDALSENASLAGARKRATLGLLNAVNKDELGKNIAGTIAGISAAVLTAARATAAEVISTTPIASPLCIVDQLVAANNLPGLRTVLKILGKATRTENLITTEEALRNDYYAKAALRDKKEKEYKEANKDWDNLNGLSSELTAGSQELTDAEKRMNRLLTEYNQAFMLANAAKNDWINIALKALASTTADSISNKVRDLIAREILRARVTQIEAAKKWLEDTVAALTIQKLTPNGWGGVAVNYVVMDKERFDELKRQANSIQEESKISFDISRIFNAVGVETTLCNEIGDYYNATVPALTTATADPIATLSDKILNLQLLEPSYRFYSAEPPATLPASWKYSYYPKLPETTVYLWKDSTSGALSFSDSAPAAGSEIYSVPVKVVGAGEIRIGTGSSPAVVTVENFWSDINIFFDESQNMVRATSAHSIVSRAVQAPAERTYYLFSDSDGRLYVQADTDGVGRIGWVTFGTDWKIKDIQMPGVSVTGWPGNWQAEQKPSAGSLTWFTTYYPFMNANEWKQAKEKAGDLIAQSAIESMEGESNLTSSVTMSSSELTSYLGILQGVQARITVPDTEYADHFASFLTEADSLSKAVKYAEEAEKSSQVLRDISLSSLMGSEIGRMRMAFVLPDGSFSPIVLPNYPQPGQSPTNSVVIYKDLVTDTNGVSKPKPVATINLGLGEAGNGHQVYSRDGQLIGNVVIENGVFVSSDFAALTGTLTSADPAVQAIYQLQDSNTPPTNYTLTVRKDGVLILETVFGEDRIAEEVSAIDLSHIIQSPSTIGRTMVFGQDGSYLGWVEVENKGTATTPDYAVKDSMLTEDFRLDIDKATQKLMVRRVAYLSGQSDRFELSAVETGRSETRTFYDNGRYVGYATITGNGSSAPTVEAKLQDGYYLANPESVTLSTGEIKWYVSMKKSSDNIFVREINVAAATLDKPETFAIYDKAVSIGTVSVKGGVIIGKQLSAGYEADIKNVPATTDKVLEVFKKHAVYVQDPSGDQFKFNLPPAGDPIDVTVDIHDAQGVKIGTVKFPANLALDEEKVVQASPDGRYEAVCKKTGATELTLTIRERMDISSGTLKQKDIYLDPSKQLYSIKQVLDKDGKVLGTMTVRNFVEAFKAILSANHLPALDPLPANEAEWIARLEGLKTLFGGSPTNAQIKDHLFGAASSIVLTNKQVSAMRNTVAPASVFAGVLPDGIPAARVRAICDVLTSDQASEVVYNLNELMKKTSETFFISVSKDQAKALRDAFIAKRYASPSGLLTTGDVDVILNDPPLSSVFASTTVQVDELNALFDAALPSTLDGLEEDLTDAQFDADGFVSAVKRDLKLPEKMSLDASQIFQIQNILIPPSNISHAYETTGLTADYEVSWVSGWLSVSRSKVPFMLDVTNKDWKLKEGRYGVYNEKAQKVGSANFTLDPATHKLNPIDPATSTLPADLKLAAEDNLLSLKTQADILRSNEKAQTASLFTSYRTNQSLRSGQVQASMIYDDKGMSLGKVLTKDNKILSSTLPPGYTIDEAALAGGMLSVSKAVNYMTAGGSIDLSGLAESKVIHVYDEAGIRSLGSIRLLNGAPQFVNSYGNEYELGAP